MRTKKTQFNDRDKFDRKEKSAVKRRKQELRQREFEKDWGSLMRDFQVMGAYK